MGRSNPSEITDYDSRRTGNGSLDAGSTPAYSIGGALKPGEVWKRAFSFRKSVHFI